MNINISQSRGPFLFPTVYEYDAISLSYNSLTNIIRFTPVDQFVARSLKMKRLVTAVVFTSLAKSGFSLVARLPTRVFGRDIDTVNAALNPVMQGLDTLDQAVKSFSGDFGPVQASADQLLVTIRTSKAQIDASDTLSVRDAARLRTPVNNLQTMAQTLVSDLKTRKPDIMNLNACDVTREKIGPITSEATALINSVVTKVPDRVQAATGTFVSRLQVTLSSANTEFNSDNCKNSAGQAPPTAAPPSTIQPGAVPPAAIPPAAIPPAAVPPPVGVVAAAKANTARAAAASCATARP